MQSLVISIMGKDKPGLVDALAKCVYKHEGNWQGSSFAHMAGMFTGFVEVHVADENKQGLIDALDAIKDLSVQSVAVASSENNNTTKLTVDVMGHDKTGIVHELTSVFNPLNLNITTFPSHCESAPNWGSPLFNAKAKLAVTEAFDDGALPHTQAAEAPRHSGPIPPTRLQLQDVESGALILLDIAAEPAKDGQAPLEPVRIVEAEAPAKRYGGGAASGADEQADAPADKSVPRRETPVPVVLTRHAAQNLYAPLRTVEPVAGIGRVNLRRGLALETLLPTLPVHARAVAQRVAVGPGRG